MSLNFKMKALAGKYELLLLLLIVCAGCIRPLDQEPDDFVDYLVVEGFINDDYGPHDLTITRISKFADVFDGGVILPIDADVIIRDQFGVETPVERGVIEKKELFGECPGGLRLVEVKTVHKTPASFKGEISNTYVLEIQVDGKIYRSDPVTMDPTPPVESLEVRFSALPSIDEVIPPSGLEVIANWNDPSEQTNYYKWIVNGIYPISTPQIAGACCKFDPRDNGATECWIIENDIKGNDIARSDITFNGQFASVQVGFIPDDGIRFKSKQLPTDRIYYLEVEQYNIPEDAFLFFDRIKTLSEISGGIFDPVPQSIRGNIYNIENEKEPVIGYFGAFSVQKKGAFIADSTFQFKQLSKQICGDCRRREGAQIETPLPYQ